MLGFFLLAGFGLAVLILGAIFLVRLQSSSKIQEMYKDSPESKSMFVKKYPGADLEYFRGLFLRVGMIYSFGFVILAFTWTNYNSNINLLTGDELLDDIEIEPPQTKQEKPPPPPPPPPELDIIEDEEEIEDEVEIQEMETDEDAAIEIQAPEEEEINEDEVFQIVEDMPGFPGGESKLMKYLANTPYPAIAHENGIEGVVYVQFVIDKTGAVTRAQVLRGQDPTLDRAALKRVKSMPRWTPGKQRGKPVKVIFRVRISFKLT